MGSRMEELRAEAPSIEVSVLIVSYNSIAPLRRCLTALEQSTQRETFEVLVVDNGSSDGCETIDSEFTGVTMLRLPRHFGLTKARNIGIRTAKGEHLLLMTPEVEVHPGTVAALAARLPQESSALAVAPLMVDGGSKVVSELRHLPTPEVVSKCWRSGVPAEEVAGDVQEAVPVELHDGSALLIRKRAIQGINYLDERFGESWGDCDLAFQIRKAGRKILLLGDVRATVREKAVPFGGVLFEADRAVGAVGYAGKNFGFMAGLGLRLKIALGALLSGELGLMSRVVEGRKIDGTDVF